MVTVARPAPSCRRRMITQRRTRRMILPVHAVLGTALLSLLPASIDRFSVTSVVIVVVVTACLTGSSLVVALHFNAVGPRRARRCGTWIGQHRSVFQVQGLRRLIEGVLWTNVLALVDGQLAVLLARIVRLSDAFLVTTASSTSTTTAAT